MKFLLKILFAPVMLLLWMLAGICNLILKVSAVVLSIAAILFAAMGIITIFTDSVVKGCIGLVIAFLFSPWGLPSLAALIVAQLYIFRLWLKEKIYE